MLLTNNLLRRAAAAINVFAARWQVCLAWLQYLKSSRFVCSSCQWQVLSQGEHLPINWYGSIRVNRCLLGNLPNCQVRATPASQRSVLGRADVLKKNGKAVIKTQLKIKKIRPATDLLSSDGFSHVARPTALARNWFIVTLIYQNSRN